MATSTLTQLLNYEGCEEFNIMFIYYYFGGYAWMFVELVKRGVFTFIGKVLRNRNDRHPYYYHY